MKNITGTVLTVLMGILIFSCGRQEKNYTVEEINGVQYFKNNGVPNGTYSPKATLLFEITGPQNVPDSMAGFGRIIDVLEDKDSNIYILDIQHAVIKKYNREGLFEGYFPQQRGAGVDQLKAPDQFALLLDTLIIYDPPNEKFLRYLINGSFVNALWTKVGVKPVMLKSDGKTNIGAFSFKVEREGFANKASNKLMALDPRMREKNVIREIKDDIDDDFFLPDMIGLYTLKDGLFYIADGTAGSYRISVSDASGEIQYEIQMEAEKIPYNEYEREQLNEFIIASKFSPLDSSTVYYKKAVNQIQVDKKDRIWAQPSMIRTEANQDSFYVDVFDKGVFINRTVLDFASGNEIFMLRGKRLFVVSEDRKSLRVYDYE